MPARRYGVGGSGNGAVERYVEGTMVNVGVARTVGEGGAGGNGRWPNIQREKEDVDEKYEPCWTIGCCVEGGRRASGGVGSVVVVLGETREGLLESA